MPFAFTEQGIAIIRAFVTFRQFSLTYSELKTKIEEIESKFPEIYNALNYLVEKDTIKENQMDRTKIGYKN